MACASRGEMLGMQEPMSGAVTVASNAGVPSLSATVSGADDDSGCGCQSCTATTPGAGFATGTPSELPMAPASTSASQSRSAPEPLIPPPQLVS
jgi:hypothetical protein